MATHRTTELAEAVAEISAEVHRQARRLARGPLGHEEQVGMAYDLTSKSLKLNAISEEVRLVNRGNKKTAPPDQEHGAAFRIAS